MEINHNHKLPTRSVSMLAITEGKEITRNFEFIIFMCGIPLRVYNMEGHNSHK